jgi:hypothetical protein
MKMTLKSSSSPMNDPRGKSMGFAPLEKLIWNSAPLLLWLLHQTALPWQ